MCIVNQKLPKAYWVVTITLIVAGIFMMTAGAVRAKIDRKEHMEKQVKHYAHETISGLDISLSEGILCLQKGEADTDCIVEINSIENTVTVDAENGIISIRDKRKVSVQLFYIGFLRPVSTEIVITLPEKTYQQALIAMNTGDCNLSDVQFAVLDISTDVGDCILERCTADIMKIRTDTGDIAINDSDIHETLHVSNAVGAFHSEHISCAGDADIRLQTGSCTLENACFSGNMAIQNDVGEIVCHNIRPDGNLTLQAGTGDVTVSVSGNEADYAIACASDVGDVYFNHEKTGSIQNYVQSDSDKRMLTVCTDVGSIDLYFQKDE